MENQPKSSKSGAVLRGIIIGVPLMVIGMYVSTKVHIGFVETLAKQGISIDPGITLATIGTFIALFPVIDFFYLSALKDAINHRTVELEKTFGEVEQLKTDMTQMKTDYDARLRETEASAREQIQAQIKEAQALRASLMAEASAKADELVKKAEQDIAIERAKLLTDLRVHVVNLALGAAEKVVGENMDSAKNKKLVEEFIDRVEVTA